MVTADFNGDGFADLAVADQLTVDVKVLLGDGKGGFTDSATLSTLLLPLALAIGDFNGDGKPDIVVDYEDNGVYKVLIFLGNGVGAFTASGGLTPVGSVINNALASLAVGDFDRDGKADLAVTNSGANTVVILLGNGDGTLKTAVSYPVGNTPASVAVGDFNNDGKADLAVGNVASNDATILLGNGSGGFTAAANSPFAAGNQPQAIVVADFDGDGNSDWAVFNLNDNRVTVLKGDGTGKFTPVAGSPFAVVSNAATKGSHSRRAARSVWGTFHFQSLWGISTATAWPIWLQPSPPVMR